MSGALTAVRKEPRLPIGVRARPRARSARRTRLVAIALRFAFVAAFVGAWQAAAGSIGALTLPTPLQAVQSLRQITDSGFWADAESTGAVIGAAFVLGGAAGLAAGAAFWRWRALGEAVEPFLITLYATPTLVFYPVLIVFFGLNLLPLILIASVMVFMPIALNTMIGLRNLSPVLPRLSRSLGTTGMQSFRKVLLPGAVPIIFAGARVGFLYATMGTVAMEMVVASSGLGYRIGLDYSNFQTQDMYGVVLIVAVLAIVLNWALTSIERKMRQDLS